MLFDDYRGETHLGEMLKICDQYRYTWETKGGTVEVNPAVVVITSNEPWSNWDKWKGFNRDPFERRVTDWIEMKWTYEGGDRIVHAHIIRGRFQDNYMDPPDIDPDDKLTDEQVEMLIAKRPTTKWLPKRRKPNYAEGQVQQAEQPADEEILPLSLGLSQL